MQMKKLEAMSQIRYFFLNFIKNHLHKVISLKESYFPTTEEIGYFIDSEYMLINPTKNQSDNSNSKTFSESIQLALSEEYSSTSQFSSLGKFLPQDKGPLTNFKRSTLFNRELQLDMAPYHLFMLHYLQNGESKEKLVNLKTTNSFTKEERQNVEKWKKALSDYPEQDMGLKLLGKRKMNLIILEYISKKEVHFIQIKGKTDIQKIKAFELKVSDKHREVRVIVFPSKKIQLNGRLALF